MRYAGILKITHRIDQLQARTNIICADHRLGFHQLIFFIARRPGNISLVSRCCIQSAIFDINGIPSCSELQTATADVNLRNSKLSESFCQALVAGLEILYQPLADKRELLGFANKGKRMIKT